jgi:hypothetical protein
MIWRTIGLGLFWFFPVSSAAQPRIQVPPRSAIERIFTLDALPEWTLGGTLDDPDREFEHRNGFLNAAVSAAGSVAVFDGHRVHFFSPAQATHRIVGRKGAGPDEFTNIISGCFTRGDTLLAYDFGLRRVSVIAAEGRIVRQFGVATYLPVWGSACSADGTLALQDAGAIVNGELQGRVVRIDTRGNKVANLGTIPVGTGALRPQIAGSGRTTILGDPRRSELRQLDAGGVVARTIALGDAPEPISPDDLAFIGLTPRRGTANRTPPGGGTPSPGNWPFFGKIFSDSDGRIWIERVRRDFKEDGEWIRLDGDGSSVALVRVPRALSSVVPAIVVGADADAVILLRRDPDGAAQVTRHRLVEVAGRRR